MTNTNRHKIQVLPKIVVDRIAAGEVVQRPCNAVKELLENSLDAKSTEICITVEINQGILDRLSVMDNGSGIAKEDLALAATRHATSKLQSCEDFLTLATFGFRGEALASISHVARLTLTTRTHDSNVAYQQRYISGEPVKINDTTTNTPAAAHAPPKPCARKPGTTVLVEDLFYNLPNRKATLRRPNDEYHRILLVAQHYAIHSAGKGVGIVCEKAMIGTNHARKKNTVDLNTSSLPSVQQMRAFLQSSSKSVSPRSSAEVSTEKQKKSQQATIDAIVHTYGSALKPHLSYFASSLLDKNKDSSSSSDINTEKEEEVQSSSSSARFIYSCTGFLTTPSFSSSNTSAKQQRTDFVLFVNDRLVECPPLKRALDEAYSRCRITNGNGTVITKPFAYLSIQVPPSQVDVNVHPTKQQVTLLHLDRICQHLQTQVLDFFSQQGQTFQKMNGLSKQQLGTTATASTKPISNPYTTRKRKAPPESSSTTTTTTTTTSAAEKGTTPDAQVCNTQSLPSETAKKLKTATTTAKKGSAMVRTDRSSQAGAIEPFLVVSTTQKESMAKQQSSSQTSNSSTVSYSQQSFSSSSSFLSQHQQQQRLQQQDADDDLDFSTSSQPDHSKLQHNASCPLSANSLSTSQVDMTQPGAFAQVAALCTCRLQQQQKSQGGGGEVEVRLVRQAIPRPKRVTPTECQYTSILQLRRRIHRHAAGGAKTKKLKSHKDGVEQGGADHNNNNKQHQQEEETQGGLLQKKLRQAVFVGVLSRNRSLIQCGEELVEINHYELGKHLFYQLALWRFAGAEMARLPSCGIDIEQIVGSAVQLEEWLNDSSKNDLDNCSSNDDESEYEELLISDTNRLLAQQVALCLLQHADMLAEYFSISIEQSMSSSDGDGCGKTKIVLTGLPVLLEGHAPSAAGLPLFLLRLATEVDWTEEKLCFHGICRELGAYYALTHEVDIAAGETNGNALHHHVRHSLFPAVSTLLIPPQELQNDDSTFRVLTTLSKLYRVFERC